MCERFFWPKILLVQFPAPNALPRSYTPACGITSELKTIMLVKIYRKKVNEIIVVTVHMKFAVNEQTDN